MRTAEALKSEYLPFFTNYVDLLHKHKRLVKIDVEGIDEKEAETLTELERADGEGKTLAAVFEGMLKAIEYNNELADSSPSQTDVNDRIQFTFRLLRIFNKVKTEGADTNECY